MLNYCSDICSFVLLRPRSLPSHSYFAEGPYLLIQALRNIRHRREARTARGLRVQQCFETHRQKADLDMPSFGLLNANNTFHT